MTSLQGFANRFAERAIRASVVTLEGGLIEVDGRMVGGGISSSRDSGIRTDNFARQAGLSHVAVVDGETDVASLDQSVKRLQKELSEAEAKRVSSFFLSFSLPG